MIFNKGIKEDFTGVRFNRLVVKECLGQIKPPPNTHYFWRSVCDCGNEVVSTIWALKKGQTKSCGCFNTDRITKHGLSRTPAYQRHYNLKILYNMTPEQWKEAFESQGQRCANPMCRATEPGPGRSKWATDHNHITKEFRGILCNGCNVALGYTNDSVEKLQGLIQYLQKETQNGSN